MSGPSDIAILIFGALFPVLAVLTVFYLVQVRRIEKRLEQGYPEKFKELGEPHLILNNSLRNNARFMSFLLGRKYETTADSALIKLCKSCRRSFVLATLVFVTMLVTLAIGAAIGNVGT